MNRIDCELLSHLIQSSKNIPNLPNFFKNLRQIYSTNFCHQTPQQLLKQAQNLNSKTKKRINKPITLHPSKSRDSFDPGELKIFLYVLGIYSLLKEISLQELLNEEQNHAEMIHKFFPGRSLTLIKYKIATVISKTKNTSKKVKQWQNEEDFLLYCSVRDQGEEWGDVSFLLFKFSDEHFFRSSQQCRMRWQNHLNPNIKKEGWSTEEDYQLLSLAYEYNFQWCQVSTEFHGERNQNTIRNRFNSLEKKYRQIFHLSNRKKLVKRILNYLKDELKVKTKQNETVETQQKRQEQAQDQILSKEQKSDEQLPLIQLSSLPCPMPFVFNNLDQLNNDEGILAQILNREQEFKNQKDDNRSTRSDFENQDIQIQLHELQVANLQKKVQNYCPSLMEMEQMQYLMHLNKKQQLHDCEKFLDQGYSFYFS